MRTALDFSPFYRSTVGFDRMFDLLANVDRVEPIDDRLIPGKYWTAEDFYE